MLAVIFLIGFKIYKYKESLTTETTSSTSSMYSMAPSTLTSTQLSYSSLGNNSHCDEEIECIADFGTGIGENVCCGQKGIVTGTKYICPINKPTCIDYKCGKYGKCT